MGMDNEVRDKCGDQLIVLVLLDNRERGVGIQSGVERVLWK